VFLNLLVETKQIELLFKDSTTLEETGRFVQEMGPVLSREPLNVMFDAYFSKDMQLYHVALTFTKYGQASSNFIELYWQKRMLSIRKSTCLSFH
jgi:hypothetical protein